MKRFKWYLHELMDNLSWRGIAGLVCIIFAFFILIGSILPNREKIKNIEFQNKNITKKVASSNNIKIKDNLLSFYDTLPLQNELTSQTRKIHEIAKVSNITIKDVSYKISKIQNTPVSSYQLKFTTDSNYRDIRYFISEVLVQLPNLALEEINFSRETSKSINVETSISMIIYYREIP